MMRIQIGVTFMDISLVKYISILKGPSVCTQQFFLLKFSITKEMEKKVKSVYKNVYCSIYSSETIIQISTEVLYNEILYVL